MIYKPGTLLEFKSNWTFGSDYGKWMMLIKFREHSNLWDVFTPKRGYIKNFIFDEDLKTFATLAIPKEK